MKKLLWIIFVCNFLSARSWCEVVMIPELVVMHSQGDSNSIIVMIRKADFFSETPDQTVFTNLSLTFFRAKSVSAKISVSGLVTLEFKEVQVYMPAKLKDHLSAGEKLQVVATGTFRLNLLSDALVQVDQYFGRAAKLADFLDKPRIASPKQEDQKP